MWPRLVANKILRKRLGSYKFVADFLSNKETLLEIPSLDQPSLSPNTIFSHHKDTQNYRIFVCTWNVGGVAPHEDLDMEVLLDTGNTSCDIYVLGFQEIVPLSTSNVLGSENSKISMKWNSLIREALNKKTGCRDKIQHSNEDGKSSIENSIPVQDFQCIISKQMVGILISVWVRSYLRPYIQYPSVSCIGCGILGCLGNKGSVSVRFRLHETSFCFVCSHLASGGREGDEKLRNFNVSEVLSRTSFPRGPSLDFPRKILDHDMVILLGDLNYKISLLESCVRLLVEGREWNALLENDQLRMELMNGQFKGWHEGSITFAPTYKYCPNSNVYYGCSQQSKKGKKKRAPAWCDRIIWYGKGLKRHVYNRSEENFSDHRPVKAIFTAGVVVLHSLKQFQSFLLSDRFDRITSYLDGGMGEQLDFYGIVGEGESRDRQGHPPPLNVMILNMKLVLPSQLDSPIQLLSCVCWLRLACMYVMVKNKEREGLVAISGSCFGHYCIEISHHSSTLAKNWLKDQLLGV
ncbi:type IV inositol polyphosphate 5-phosphatase 9-like [Durio zibethinus]|uniref:Type IV inositol polyphosphate 5-phosphatase 9-like n=1 Tax=Durio zibethinus TaxID=66656 RepID=A0A6P5X9B7_DURZI|nr:type IV inositol polyphosphate 5-phosphatase 9-like [Durio zibethinus]